MEPFHHIDLKTNVSSERFTNGCFQNFDKVGCIRDSIEAIISLLTVIFCLVKIVKLHIVRHELWNQYLIFYAAILELILLTINWLYVHEATIDIVAELLKLFQFLIVCRFYCEIASRMSKTENLYKRYLLPALVATFFYFVVLIIVGIVEMKENANECNEPEWLLLSCSEVAVGIVFIIVGVYITKQTNRLKTDGFYKRNVRLSLWGIILSFELSSLASMSYDLVMIFVGKQNHCKGIFLKNVVAYTSSHITIKMLKWLLPIWAMLLVFKSDSFKGDPNIEENSDPPPIVQRSSDGIFTSEFRPRGRSFNYKHLRNTENESERKLLDPDSNVPSVQRVKKKRRRTKRNGHNKGGGSESSDNITSPSYDQMTGHNPSSINPGGSNIVILQS